MPHNHAAIAPPAGWAANPTTMPEATSASRTAASVSQPSFAAQERVLIGLNLFALAALALVHLVFRNVTDPVSFILVLLLFGARFLEQGGEWLWLRRYGGRLSAATAMRWSYVSIAANMTFAGLVSVAADSVDAHYTVLLIIPVVAAAFRLCFFHLLFTIGIAAGLAMLEIWVYFLRHPPIDVEEFFEVATEGLVFVVVGLVSWGLVNSMRRDAATLKRALDELRHTQDRLVAEEKLAAVGRLSSAIAHEIRNPVGAIVSALATGQRPELPEATRAEMHALAATEAGRLEKLTTDFLAYARTRPPDLQPIPVRDTLEYVAGLMRARAGEAPLEIRVDCAGEFRLRADGHQVQQALINLAINALEHTPADGRVVLGAAKEKGMAALFVENTGSAVPDPASLFEPFFTTRPNGTGLGLAISRNIARAHGGDCMLSHNISGAVRFTLMLPLEDRSCHAS
jgi:signal transduction histidine kinase